MNALSMLCLAVGVAAVSADLCTTSNIDAVARIVFGEARGEPAKGQLAVAWSVVNRVHHSGYPSNVHAVVYQKYNHGHNYQYNTLDDAGHTSAWNHAKASNSATYQAAVHAARGALCNEQADPTSCATAYCARDPCSATNSNQWYAAYNKQHIGHHYFVCQRAVVG